MVKNQDKNLIIALEYFNNKSFVTIQELINWQNENSKLYEDFEKKRYIKFIKKDELPTSQELKQNYIDKYYNDFCVLYTQIKYFTNLFKFNSITNIEIKKYQEIKEDEKELKKWLIRNEQLGSKDLIIFGWELYDDEVENITPEYIKVISTTYEHIKFDINIIDFKSIISFCDIFSELFYIRKLYPEAL
jgi:hypothetical protein